MVISHYDILNLVSNFSAFRKNNIFWLLRARNFKLKRILVCLLKIYRVDTKQSDVQITKKNSYDTELLAKKEPAMVSRWEVNKN